MADPERYLGPPAPPVAVPEGTIWTCPMHPEIRQDHPGSCTTTAASAGCSARSTRRNRMSWCFRRPE
ncbi:heavy metal-binding domain-containing protein [Escherichia coli]|uniref:heavy metal-binding domain-containing protein n=1 Tax=Escherichia coli TaxID=562 RepID=UPI00331508B3